MRFKGGIQVSNSIYADNLERILRNYLEYVGEKKVLVLYYKENFGFPSDQQFERLTRPIIGAFRPFSLFKKRKYTGKNRDDVIKEEVDLLMEEYYALQDDCISVLNMIKKDTLNNEQVMQYYQKFAAAKERLFKPSINDYSTAKILGWKTIFGKDIR